MERVRKPGQGKLLFLFRLQHAGGVALLGRQDLAGGIEEAIEPRLQRTGGWRGVGPADQQIAQLVGGGRIEDVQRIVLEGGQNARAAGQLAAALGQGRLPLLLQAVQG